MRSMKNSLDSEKEIRTTLEFDIARLRSEIADMTAAHAKEKNNNERQINDLKYQNEENIRQTNLRNDDITNLNKQIDALNLTIEAKDNTIQNLKDSVVEAEMKTGKA